MEYNSNTMHEPKRFRRCNKQQQMWNGTDQNDENKNFLGGYFFMTKSAFKD
jgi:hypothetical protein